MNNIFGIFQLIGGIILSIGYIPQIVQIFRTKSSEGLNFKSFGMIFAGIWLYEIYAISLVVINDSGHMYLITNSISMLLSGSMCLLIKIFAKKGRVNDMEINETVRDILAECTIEGNILKLPDRQLDRKIYTDVNKVLEHLGGKWNRKLKGHLFDSSPEAAIEEVILSGEYTNLKKEFQFFETPTELASRLCDMAEITSDCIVIEPSVGKGRIADEIMKRYPAKLYCFEINKDMEKYLKDKPYAVYYEDFLNLSKEYDIPDRIVMNPPFSKQQDIDHVYKAFECLKPGGILVSIMSISHTYRTNKKSELFREFLEQTGAETEFLPQGTFKESGTMANTCVIKIRKSI